MPSIKITVDDSLKEFLDSLSEKTGKPKAELIRLAIVDVYFDKLPQQLKTTLELKELEELQKIIQKIHKFQKTVLAFGRYNVKAIIDKRQKGLSAMAYAKRVAPELLPQLEKENKLDLKAQLMKERISNELSEKLEKYLVELEKQFGKINLENEEMFLPKLPEGALTKKSMARASKINIRRGER